MNPNDQEPTANHLEFQPVKMPRDSRAKAMKRDRHARKWEHLDLSVDDGTPRRPDLGEGGKRSKKHPDGPVSISGRFDRRDPDPVDSDEVPDPGPWSRALALATLEIMMGLRSINQIQPWVSPELFKVLARRVTLNDRLGKDVGRCVRPNVLSTRTCTVRPGVVETVHVIDDSGHGHGVAVRLEHHRRRWIGTAIEVI